MTASALFQAETLQLPHTAFLQQRQAPGVAVGTYLPRTGTINGFVASIFFAFFKVFFAIFVPPRLIRPCGRLSRYMQRSRQTRWPQAIRKSLFFLQMASAAATGTLKITIPGVEIIIAC